MEPHYADEVYRAHDGVRDPFRWSRFAGTRTLLGGLFIALVMIFVAGRDSRATIAGLGVQAGSHVAGTAVRVTIALTE